MGQNEVEVVNIADNGVSKKVAELRKKNKFGTSADASTKAVWKAESGFRD